MTYETSGSTNGVSVHTQQLLHLTAPNEFVSKWLIPGSFDSISDPLTEFNSFRPKWCIYEQKTGNRSLLPSRAYPRRLSNWGKFNGRSLFKNSRLLFHLLFSGNSHRGQDFDGGDKVVVVDSFCPPPPTTRENLSLWSWKLKCKPKKWRNEEMRKFSRILQESPENVDLQIRLIVCTHQQIGRFRLKNINLIFAHAH